MALADETTTVTAHEPKSYSAARVWVLIAIVLLLLAAAMVPSLINISRYQHRIAEIIGNSIGRRVHMSAVKLRLLPLPGFEISDFVVDEDPAFGAEPMLRSASVVASVRLASMWRGRLEIARINFDEPSLNLVRRSDGQWNFGSVLLKASATPNAPTAQRHLGSAPRFPYIEVTNARINFKTGDEKRPFSFLNADLSVWLDNPDEWRVRFEAQLVRTDLDLDLADTGVLTISGSVKRAAALNDVPLMLHAEWTKAPLGQLSRLLAGRDAGWRGDMEMRADISGTGENALLKTQLKATNVHRIEFAPAEPMDLDANCQARYTRATHSLEDVACASPVGNGHLLMQGAIREMQQERLTNLNLDMQKVPVSAMLGLARSVREGFAPNLKAIGSIDGAFQYSDEAAGAARLQGGATVSGLVLSAPALDRALLLPTLRLSADGPSAPIAPVKKRGGVGSREGRRGKTARENAESLEPALLLSSFELPSGGTSPLMVDGRFTGRRYQMHFAGTANVKSLIAYSKAFGLLGYTANQLAPIGSAALDLRTSGTWLAPIVASDGFADLDPTMSSSTDGRLQLKNARITTDYLADPLDVISAQAVFNGAGVLWDPASVNYGKVHADGSLQYSQQCSEDPCVATFKLKFATLDAAAAQAELLGASGRTEFIEELLARLDHRAHPWPALSGTFEAATLALNQLQLHDVRAALEIGGNEVDIQAFDARALGGAVHLTGTIDASGQQPDYALQAAWTKVNAADVAALFHEKWGTGQISGTTHLQLTGYKLEDLTSSANGTFHWDWTQGGLPVQAGAEGDEIQSALPHFQRWSAGGTIGDGKLSVVNGNMVPSRGTGNGAESIRGTISFQRELNLSIGTFDGGRGRNPAPNASPSASPSVSANVSANVSVSGTLAQPRLQITHAPQAEKNASQASVR